MTTQVKLRLFSLNCLPIFTRVLNLAEVLAGLTDTLGKKWIRIKSVQKTSEDLQLTTITSLLMTQLKVFGEHFVAQQGQISSSVLKK